MSAYVCSRDHFVALAVFAATKPRRQSTPRVDPTYVDCFRPVAEKLLALKPHELASVYAEALYQENVRSVSHRYPNDPRDGLPGEPSGVVDVSARNMIQAVYALPPLHILKMCNGLDYQSCETDDWRETRAYALLQAIKDAAIRELPGYDDGPWDYHVEAKAA